MEPTGQDAQKEAQKLEEKKNRKTFWQMFWAFFMPTVIGKIFVMQFGAMYSDEPGVGWGYWLTGAICFTVFSLGRFLWKFRDYKD